jgi:hypothetical protein
MGESENGDVSSRAGTLASKATLLGSSILARGGSGAKVELACDAEDKLKGAAICAGF